MRAMRKKESEMPKEGAASVLKNGEYGILSTMSKDGTPYGVPINYVFEGDEIFIHGANEGHKMDNMLHNSDVCFTVVGKATFIPERSTTAYESAIVFGKASMVTSDDEKKEIMGKFIKRFLPYAPYDEVMKGVGQAIALHGVVGIKITGMSGKFRE